MLYGPKAGGAWPGGVSLVGPAGATGATGATGPAGPTGATGATGAPGTAGPAGNTVLSGTTAPANGVGVDGDYYINTSTNMLYGPKAGGVWPAGISLVGPAGATGATGATGAAGPAGSTGATGATGATGPAGATVTVGTIFVSRFGAPPSLLTDFYMPISGLTTGTLSYQFYNRQATTMPASCTFSSIYVSGTITSSSPPPNTTVTVTLWKNGAATPLSTSVALSTQDVSVTSSSSANPVSVSPSDTVALQVHVSDTTAVELINVSTVCQ
jgi:hypothetical protein